VRKIYSLFVLAIIILTLVSPLSVSAQSGRGRTPNPARDPKPATAPPVSVPDATSVIKQEQAGTVSRFLLKNGITVIINEQHAAPITATVAYFKVGALDESDTLSGATSLLARMVFRGTQFRAADQIMNQTRALGAMMAAQAGFDNTSFYLIAPPDKLKEALAIQADILQHPALKADDLRKEIALNLDFASQAIPLLLHRNNAFSDLPEGSLADRETPANFAMARLLSVALRQNKSVRGWQHNPAITAEQLMSFYKAQYRPDNLIITVVGDVSTFHTLVEIQRLYGTFKSTPQTQDSVPNSQPTGDKKTNESATTKVSTQAKPSEAAATIKPKTKPTVIEKTKIADTKATKKTDTAAATSSASKTPNAQSIPPNTTPNTPGAQPPTTDAQTVQTPQTPLQYGNERSHTSQSIVSVGYRFAGLDGKERATIEVLCALLAEGRASRLHRSLVEGQGLIRQVEANYFALADAGMLAVQMQMAPNSIDRAESAFFKEVNTLRREIPSEGEMTRAKMWLEKRFFDKSTTYMDRAWLLARAEATQGGLPWFTDYRKRLQAVTAADVQRAAAKYLTFANTSVHEYEARTATPRTFDAEKFAATVLAWSPTYAEPVDAKQVRATDDKNIISTNAQSLDKSTDELGALESIQPLPVKNFSTLNGPQAYVREDHSQPRVNMAILFLGGRMIEDETNSGITELMLRSMLYGTAKRAQVAQELEQIGADIEVVMEPDFYGLNVNVLSHYAPRALKIARDLIEEPAFREEEVKLARDEQLSLYQHERDSCSARSRELFFQALYANHPYSFPLHGREDILKKITGEVLQTWHSRTIKRQLPLVVIVGDTEGSALVSSEVATGFRRNDTDATLKARVPTPGKPAEIVESSPSAKTVITTGFTGAKGSSEELATLELIKALLNGNSGRLFSELRNKQGLVYEVCVDNRAMLISGAIFMQAVVAPENEQKARGALLAEADRLAKAGASADELSNAKALAVTMNLWRLQSPRARMLEYARAILYQRQAADVDNFAERLSKISADEIKRVASSYFKVSASSSGIVRGTPTQK
jgi:zinc protease